MVFFVEEEEGEGRRRADKDATIGDEMKMQGFRTVRLRLSQKNRRPRPKGMQRCTKCTCP